MSETSGTGTATIPTPDTPDSAPEGKDAIADAGPEKQAETFRSSPPGPGATVKSQEEEAKDTLDAIKRIATELLNGEVGNIASTIEKLQLDSGERQKDNITNGPPPIVFPDAITQHETENNNIQYISYESELQMPSIMKLIQKDLSEPYSIYTYRYFIHNWPKLCFLAIDTDRCNMVVGAIVCKLDIHKHSNRRGYIAMLAVDEAYRRKKIGSSLVLRSIRAMAVEDADEIVLETEITNKSALRLYENLGFVRDKRLFRYYLNGVDALRLKLWLK